MKLIIWSQRKQALSLVHLQKKAGRGKAEDKNKAILSKVKEMQGPKNS